MAAGPAAPSANAGRPAPAVLVCDVLDTLVADPFTHGMHEYFGYATLQDFIKAKRPNTWVYFELGDIDERDLAEDFFLDGRPLDLLAFKAYLSSTYALLPGARDLLQAFKARGAPVHLCSNYPAWYTLIEDALRLRDLGAHWTFVSANACLRKPDPRAYLEAARLAGVRPEDCVLLDDRQTNCDGALDAGFRAAVRFESAEQARRDLAPHFGQWLVPSAAEVER